MAVGRRSGQGPTFLTDCDIAIVGPGPDVLNRLRHRHCRARARPTITRVPLVRAIVGPGFRPDMNGSDPVQYKAGVLMRLRHIFCIRNSVCQWHKTIPSTVSAGQVQKQCRARQNYPLIVKRQWNRLRVPMLFWPVIRRILWNTLTSINWSSKKATTVPAIVHNP